MKSIFPLSTLPFPPVLTLLFISCRILYIPCVCACDDSLVIGSILVDRLGNPRTITHIGITQIPTSAQAFYAAPIIWEQIGSKAAHQPQGLHQRQLLNPEHTGHFEAFSLVVDGGRWIRG